MTPTIKRLCSTLHYILYDGQVVLELSYERKFMGWQLHFTPMWPTVPSEAEKEVLAFAHDQIKLNKITDRLLK